MMNSTIKQYADIRYIKSEEAYFYKTEGNLLGLKLNGEDLGRVGLFRMFPLNDLRHFISVREEKRERNDRKGEIGVIENIDSFSKDQLALIEEELDRRYFVPEITEVIHVKDEFGYTYWDVETTAGKRSFILFDMNNNVITLSDGRVLLIDVDGNRYQFANAKNIDDKALKFINIWL